MFKSSIYNNLIFENGKSVIYNSLSKARISLCNDTELDDFIIKINNNKLDEYDEKQFGMLVKNGFIVNEKKNEKSLLKYIFTKRYFASDKLGLILMPTLNCNFSCPYCFEKPYKGCVKKESNEYFAILKKFILLNAQKYKHIHLNFFGGEPLLMKSQIIDFKNEFVDIAKKIGFTYSSSMVTNGSLLDDKIFDALIDLNCNLLQITIDGSKKQHDVTRTFANGNPSFDLIVQKINGICEQIKNNEHFTLLIRFNLNNTSTEDIKSTLEEFRLENRRKISLLFRPVFNTNDYVISNYNTYDDLDKFNELGVELGFNIYKNRRVFLSCEACGDMNFFHVLPDLSLWKCINDLSFNEAHIGNMLNDGNVEWNFAKIYNWFEYSDFLSDDKCNKCSIAPDCLGGCIKNYALTKNRKCGSCKSLSSVFKY